jgi:hypothetical protein
MYGQINSPVMEDNGVWNVSITSISGELIHRSIHMIVQGRKNNHVSCKPFIR